MGFPPCTVIKPWGLVVKPRFCCQKPTFLFNLLDSVLWEYRNVHTLLHFPFHWINILNLINLCYLPLKSEKESNSSKQVEHLSGPTTKCSSMLCKSREDFVTKFRLHLSHVCLPGSMSSMPSWPTILWCSEMDSLVLYCFPQFSMVHWKKAPRWTVLLKNNQ